MPMTVKIQLLDGLKVVDEVEAEFDGDDEAQDYFDDVAGELEEGEGDGKEDGPEAA